MFYIKKKIVISASHKLNLDYPSKCSNLHGHNWIITVECKGDILNANGMLIDFTDIRKEIMKLDHTCLNDVLPFQPTAENLAKYICELIPFCFRVSVKETDNNEAVYEKENQ